MLSDADRRELAALNAECARIEATYAPDPPELVACRCTQCRRRFAVVEAEPFCSAECVNGWNGGPVEVGGVAEPW